MTALMSETIRIDVARERYAGWLDVMRTASGDFDSYRTDCLVDFDGGWAELRRFAWSRQVRSLWHTGERCYFLSLALDEADRTNRHNLALPSAMQCGGPHVLLVPPGQTISSVSLTSGKRRSMRCLIDVDFVESICLHKPTPEERARLGAIELSGGRIEWLLVRMYREITDAEIGMRVAVESIAHEIAVEIARTLERQRRSVRRRSGGLPPWRMRLMLDRVHADGPLPKVSELAAIGGMTARHLGRVFQAETGRTIGQLITSVMAERADRLLKAGMPVAAVAASLGYASSSSFAQAFRRETGVLPSSIRAG